MGHACRCAESLDASFAEGVGIYKKAFYASIEFHDLKRVLPVNHLGVADEETGAREPGSSLKFPH